MIKKLPLLAAALLLFASNSLSAAVLLGWNFSGVDNFGPSPLAADFESTGINSSGLVRGPGLTAIGTAQSNAWGATGWGSTSASSAFTNGDYFSFTLTADPGVSFTLSQIDGYSVRKDATGNMFMQWQYSLDGSTFTNLGSATGLTGLSNGKGPVNLSSVPDDISSVTIRVGIYFQSTVDSSAEVYLQNGNSPVEGNYFTVSGTSVIPEPGAAGLLSLAVGAMLMVRRNRARHI